MIRVAVIGTGNISPAHLTAYLQFPERCRIEALVDIYPDKAERRRAEFGLDAAVFSSHTEALARCPEVRLVSICTPPYTHAQIAIDCMRAGKDVLVEKPMASSVAECDQMIRVARETGRTLSVVAQNRFRTPVMNLKKTLDTGLAGPVVHAQVDSFWWRGHCYYDLWWRGTWEKEGGGCTLNHAVHHIDMLCWMLGRPTKVQAVMANTSHDNAEVEDLSVAILTYPGALAQVTSSTVHHGEEQQLVFQCRGARISVPWKVSASLSKANGFPEPHPTLAQALEEAYRSLPPVVHEAHFGQIDDVLSALETGRAPLIGGEDGRTTVEVIAAIYQSATLERPVAVPLAPDAAFATREGILAQAPRFYQKKAAVENFADEAITTGSTYRQEK